MHDRIDPASAAALGVEVLLWLVGFGLLWKLILSRTARARQRPQILAAWTTPPSGFMLYIGSAFFFWVAFQTVAVAVLARISISAEWKLVLIATIGDLGALAAMAAMISIFEPSPSGEQPAFGRAAKMGAATFLIALPIINLSGLGWEALLTLFGLPVERQEIVDVIIDDRSPVRRILWAILAIVIAPTVEELLFRKGFFRYLRTRVPRKAALFGTALLFGLLHVDWGNWAMRDKEKVLSHPIHAILGASPIDWSTLDGLSSLVPLTVFGVILALSYERSGKIATPIIAHALFNLNTLVLVVAGVNV